MQEVNLKNLSKKVANHIKVELDLNKEAEVTIQKIIESNLSGCEIYEKTYDDIDAHSCSMCADSYGYCEVCGAVVPGTLAYSDLYGGD